MLDKIYNFLNSKIFNRIISGLLLALFILFAILNLNIGSVIIGYIVFIFVKTLYNFIYNKIKLKGEKKNGRN